MLLHAHEVSRTSIIVSNISKSQSELKKLMRILVIPSARRLHGEEEESARLWAAMARVDIPELSLGDQTAEVWNLFFS